MPFGVGFDIGGLRLQRRRWRRRLQRRLRAEALPCTRAPTRRSSASTPTARSRSTPPARHAGIGIDANRFLLDLSGKVSLLKVLNLDAHLKVEVDHDGLATLDADASPLSTSSASPRCPATSASTPTGDFDIQLNGRHGARLATTSGSRRLQHPGDLASTATPTHDRHYCFELSGSASVKVRAFGISLGRRRPRLRLPPRHRATRDDRPGQDRAQGPRRRSTSGCSRSAAPSTSPSATCSSRRRSWHRAATRTDGTRSWSGRRRRHALPRTSATSRTASRNIGAGRPGRDDHHRADRRHRHRRARSRSAPSAAATTYNARHQGRRQLRRRQRQRRHPRQRQGARRDQRRRRQRRDHQRRHQHLHELASPSACTQLYGNRLHGRDTG